MATFLSRTQSQQSTGPGQTGEWNVFTPEHWPRRNHPNIFFFLVNVIIYHSTREGNVITPEHRPSLNNPCREYAERKKMCFGLFTHRRPLGLGCNFVEFSSGSSRMARQCRENLLWNRARNNSRKNAQATPA